MKTKRLLVLSVLTLAGFGLACGDSTISPVAPSLTDPGDPTAGTSRSFRPQTSSGTARIRVAHLSTDAPAVDVWVNGQVVLSNVPYKAVSDYLALDSGEYRIQVTPTGAPSPMVIDAMLPLEAGKVYTVAATGFLASDAGASTSLQPLVLVDNLAIGSGARIRLVHTSADTGSVDLAVTGGPILFENVSYRKASGYGEVPGGAYDLEVRPTGSSAVALSLPGIEVADGTTYTVFAIGRSYDGSLEALPVIDAR